MPANLCATVMDVLWDVPERAGAVASITDVLWDAPSKAGAVATIADLLTPTLGPADMRATIADVIYPAAVPADMRATIAEYNNITSPTPEKLKIWDAPKGQYVTAPRYVWDGSAWQVLS